MKTKTIIIIFILGFFVNNINAEDTIRVMQYNLLYYGKQTDFCTTSNNNIDNKNGHLQTIIEYTKPDIFSVNELDGEAAYPVADDAQYLLDNALNVNGVDYYRKTESPPTYLANIIFYNANKLVLKSSHDISFVISGNDKVFNAYKFYYNSDALETTNDTAFFYCVVAHLKAGDGSTERAQRAYETSKIMDYFENIGEEGNYLVMGDFNVYSPTEACFQNLISPDNSWYTFNDPANQIGEWSKNYNYRYHHTQSTHYSSGCAAGGGMDDRFDFILASDYIMDGTNHFEYISDSYKAVGQDGSNYDGSLNTTSNSVVPNNVALALYNMSDHLPVYLEIKVDQNRGEPLGLSNIKNAEINVTYQNPVNNNINITIEGNIRGEITLEIISLKGLKMYQKEISVYNQYNEMISVDRYSDGIYILNVSKGKELLHSSKLVVKN